MTENASSNTKYFDLHVTGIGYLNRAREVPVRRGDPFLALDISALHGAADQVEYTRFDCRVSGTEAQKAVRQLMHATEADRKVLVSFKLGDLYPETFTYQKGERAGQTGVSLKARLLWIGWAKVDGETVYTAPRASGEPAGTQEGSGDTQTADSSSAPAEGDAPAKEEGAIEDRLPEEVALSKDDPGFEAKKARLKEQGYRFDGESKTWRLQARAA